jgi:2-keto-4-pentenoate hydratase/2-oxohepta-3-ene-1,7-dioic acid hydratase in catechol pathway
MKILAYSFLGVERVGAIRDDGIIDIGSRLGVGSIRELIERDLVKQARELERLGADHNLSTVTFLPVIPDPHHLYCVGINYADHLKEVQAVGVSRPAPKKPSLFIRFPDTLVAHGAPMLIPKVSNDFDYEAELAVIIGKGGRYIEESRALDHVAGYSCFNDGSVRDWQFHTTQVTPGKNFSATGGFGPWLVTEDEIPDPHGLEIKLILNGQTLQHGNTRDLIFSIPMIISYVSAFVPLRAGDVIATGTPAGVGFSRKPPIFMKAGDVCEVHIEKIGVLRNPIAKDNAR